MVKFRSPYDEGYDPSAFATPVGDEPSLTRQAFAEECDVNLIVARSKDTGMLTHYNEASPQYIDVTSVPDYQDALNTVLAAQASFSALPSIVRERFGNNPANLVSFLGDESNRDEAVKLGLVNPTPSEAPARPSGEVSSSAATPE